MRRFCERAKPKFAKVSFANADRSEIEFGPEPDPNHLTCNPCCRYAKLYNLPEEEGRQVMAYDPRTDTGIPTEPIGSLPRPSKLQNAFAAYDAGDITKEALEAEQEEAVKDSIERFEAENIKH